MLITSITVIDQLSGNPYVFSMGQNGVVEIREHRPAGVGDKWFYDVINTDGKNVRLFEFCSVGFEQN